MSNPIVEALQENIGQKIENSPSPVSRWLKGTLLSVEEGKLRIEVSIREEMTNPMGILHGGAAALIMDDVIGSTVYTLNREVFYTSTNLSIDYLNPAQNGERVIAVGEIVRAGKTMINASCRILNEQGLTIARGSSNLVRTHIDKANALPNKAVDAPVEKEEEKDEAPNTQEQKKKPATKRKPSRRRGSTTKAKAKPKKPEQES